MWEPGDVHHIIELQSCKNQPIVLNQCPGNQSSQQSYSTWNLSKDHTIFLIAPAVTEAASEAMFVCGNLSIVPVLTDLDDWNSTLTLEELITGKDAAWVLTSSVIIFTMQTGESAKTALLTVYKHGDFYRRICG